jgi:hypothetical protein
MFHIWCGDFFEQGSHIAQTLLGHRSPRQGIPFQPYLGDTHPLKVLQDNRVLASRQLTRHGREAMHIGCQLSSTSLSST